MTTDKEPCPHYAKTGLKPPRGGVEKTCRACPLHNERGDCIQDIIDDMGEQTGDTVTQAAFEVAEIWGQFNERKHAQETADS